MNDKNEAIFSKRITLILKGLMIVWLIMHHALASKHYVSDGSTFVFLMSKLASRGSAVVAGFALLSGYGLNETYKKWTSRMGREPDLKGKIAFSYTRGLRLLVSLWIVYFIFVGAILLFRNPDFLRQSYEGPVWLGVLRNLSGNLLPIKNGTVNKSWWFVRAILSFYLIYPFVKCGRGKLWAFGVTLVSFLVTIPILDHAQNTRIFWYCQFFLGYFISEIDLFGRLRDRVRMPVIFIVSLAAFLGTNYVMYKYVSYPLFPLWAFTIVLLFWSAYWCFPGLEVLWKPLEYLGKYSSDMYLLHVFIHGSLLPEVIYFSMNPLWVVISDVLICLALSWLLSKLKEKTGLTAKLNGLCPDKRQVQPAA